MTRTERKTLRAQREVDEWNALVAVGDFVEYREVMGIGPVERLKTRTKAMILSGHTAVVWLEGKRGCVCASHCKPASKSG